MPNYVALPFSILSRKSPYREKERLSRTSSHCSAQLKVIPTSILPFILFVGCFWNDITIHASPWEPYGEDSQTNIAMHPRT